MMDHNPLKHLETLEEGSFEPEESSSNDRGSSTNSERDEVQEVRNISKRETSRVTAWRLIATGVLILTAVAVTLTTYFFLERQVKQSFETQNDPGAWPFFHMPLYVMYGNDLRQQGNLEVTMPLMRVERSQLEEWETFVAGIYEDVVFEAHMIQDGDLHRLSNNATSTFHDYVYKVTPEGKVPDDERETYWPVIDSAPAPHSYGMVNWNVASSDIYGPMIDAMLSLKYDAVLSPVKSYEASIGTVITEEEHEAMHENLNILDGSSRSPHTFWSFPVHEIPTDTDSKIVAAHLTTMAWDVFMLGLLPEGVKGISVVLENSCDQSFTFELDGPRVYYVGEAVAFHTYDVFVQRRNEKLVKNAARSNAIVASLFPSNIRDRLLNVPQHPAVDDNQKKRTGSIGLKQFMSGGMVAGGDLTNGKPLADLFLECTIMFADIAGFTAWSSTREPSQVFTILETLYGAFDQIATKSRKVLKIETVGDCYVAASGIPDYHREHAVIMVKFARDILAKMISLTKELEVTLGPDTGDLSLRIGIHSGPVTGGVLRGERSRFQLFGDSMNVCSRVESTGTAGRIQLSHECAQQLIANGKERWLIKREEKVQAKGKGEIQTYWLSMGVCQDRRDSSSVTSSSSGETLGVYEPMHDNIVTRPAEAVLARICPAAKASRLVDWNVQMLSDILRNIVSRRRAKQELGMGTHSVHGMVSLQEDDRHGNLPRRLLYKKDSKLVGFENSRPLNEVQEIIELPEFDAEAATRAQDSSKVELDRKVLDQLRGLCMDIASRYNTNWFHNFSHASHVTMSVVKLLSRIVAPTESTENEISLHDHTYGITSDPLTQFACAFAAMIHDVNHQGVPNAQLVKEGAEVVTVFGERSVAEQNSVVIAWDIVDRDLKNLRNLRWDRAFNETEEVSEESSSRAAVNRKATIVIEHLLQASDVAHTMQHWHVYRKWNERFFRECMTAYLNGRADKNPADNWYEGELGFFDYYVIPLTKKLKDCGVFGKSSDEYLTYAMSNREEWALRGEDLVRDMCAAMDLVDRELHNPHDR
eukprot:Nitzschia sp. Nitz4//scaffold129_size63868//17137//21252//NITZ4_006196-RA/size63868-processed-gene-0.67-mRNA-1//-1//CDS//3329534896//393//frame0